MESKYKAADYRHYDKIPIKRALISVSDKRGLLDLAKSLATAGVEIVSTGSTAKTIADAGIKVTEVSKVTGFEETLDGRVKTLHPSIHAGLLADLRLVSHQSQLKDLNVEPFQLVVVNLYPFVEAITAGATGEASY
jgi:phosphoribosylaminoimidazolecarboxamide formyltransferase / IMP cyclohydrolase